MVLGISVPSYAYNSNVVSENIQFENSYVDSSRVAPVVVFVGGILVGYIIDGVLIYATGYDGGELAASLIDKIMKFHIKYPQYTSIHVSSSGKIHGGMSFK